MFSLKLYMLPNLLSHIIGCDTLSEVLPFLIPNPEALSVAESLAIHRSTVLPVIISSSRYGF
jgi:hypothetical protein